MNRGMKRDYKTYMARDSETRNRHVNMAQDTGLAHEQIPEETGVVVGTQLLPAARTRRQCRAALLRQREEHAHGARRRDANLQHARGGSAVRRCCDNARSFTACKFVSIAPKCRLPSFVQIDPSSGLLRETEYVSRTYT